MAFPLLCVITPLNPPTSGGKGDNLAEGSCWGGEEHWRLEKEEGERKDEGYVWKEEYIWMNFKDMIGKRSTEWRCGGVEDCSHWR